MPSETVAFLREYFRGPRAVGAVAPSSRFLARTMVESGDLAAAKTIVELGPGTGAFTQAIAEAVDDSATFLALEINPEFAERVRERVPRATVYNDSAANLASYLERHGKDGADCVLSGLPWASLPMKVQDSVMAAVVDNLRPGGIFATFAYIHALALPNARKFRRRLESLFGKVELSPIVWRNVPPAFVYRCRR